MPLPALPSWTIDLMSLELLLAVAELGSVGKAAAAHGISQPAASTRLDRLERQTGLPLLVRTTTGSTLTPTGQAFAAWATTVVEAAASLAENVRTLRDSRSARLRLAASLTVAEYLMPAWLLRLRRDSSGLEVTATVANSHDVCERVRSGAVDLGFVEMPSVPDDLTARRVAVDHLVLVAAPDYPAARRASVLPARELVDLPLLLREEGSGTRDTFVSAVAAALGPAAKLPHAVELGSTATILATARAGGGIGVISSRAARADLAAGALAIVEVDGLDTARALTAVWLGRTPSPAAAALVELAVRTTDADG